ncbi:hypothetical protein G6F57_015444 [Rhizopus arrhizus]|nr:hypothetical protein G6F57_015444 [Rhizopus arrhizus]
MSRVLPSRHLLHLVVPDGLDLALGHLLEQLVLHDLFRLQGVAAVDQVDLAGDVGQVQRLFHGGIAAADHDHVLVAVEETVTGGAGRHAAALELVLGRDAQVLGGGAGGDDQGIAGVLVAVADQLERALRLVGGMDVVEDDLGLEALGMGLHACHQVRPHQAVGVTRPVVHLGGGHQLAALLQAGDDDRLQVGTGGVDGGGPAGRAGTEDDEALVAGGQAGAHVDSRKGRWDKALAMFAQHPWLVIEWRLGQGDSSR